MTYRKLAGLALRQCIDLGYHRNTKHFAPAADLLQIELRKRVFWCAYVVETQAAVMLGRPLGVPYQEVDVEVCFEGLGLPAQRHASLFVLICSCTVPD